MRHILLSTILILSCLVMQGQTGTGEKPLSWAADIPALRAGERAQKQMPALDLQRIEAEDRQRKTAGEPLRFGYRREVNFTLENSGEWTDAPDGGRLWRLEIECPDALGIGLGYDKFWLPAGAKFWVYSADRKRNIGAFTSANNNGDHSDMRGFATALIVGSRVVLEYYLPEEADETGVISISSVIHGYLYLPFLGIEPPPGYRANDDLCNHVSVECPAAQPWIQEKNAVALIVCGNEVIGTGALINNTNKDDRPLFLTADHVYQARKGFDQYVFYWNYDGSCGTYYDDLQNSNPPTTNGAKSILASYTYSTVGKGSDFILFELNDDPKYNDNITPYYLGWNRGSPGTGGAGIHHPKGAAKKIAIHSMQPDDNGCEGVKFWHIQWDKSIVNGIYATQTGSSGSPLLDANKLVIGQLWGKCLNENEDCGSQEHHSIYGKLSVSWDGGGSSGTRLKDWLHPTAGTAPDTIHGKTVGTPVSYTGTKNMTVGDSAPITVNSPPKNAVWVCSNHFTVSGSGNTATVTAVSAGTGWVSIEVNGWIVRKHEIKVTAGKPAVIGPDEISFPNYATYTLVNPPSGAGTIYWTISHSGFFNVPSSGNPISINISGPGAGYNTLSARTGSTSGTVIATKTITQTTALVGPDKFCFDGQYNLYGASAISWSVSPSSPIMSISSSTSNSATVTSNYFSGQTGTLTAIIGSQSQVVTKNIAACAATIAGPPFICDTETYFLSFGQATGWSIQQNGSVFSIVSSSVNTVTVSASSTNGETGALIATMPGGSVQIPIKASCGKSSASSYVTAYPNPVNVILTVDVDAAAGQFASGFGRQAPTFDVRLYDGQGNMLRQTTAKGGTVQFNVSNLLNGMYYLLIYDDAGSKPIMETIMVEH